MQVREADRGRSVEGGDAGVGESPDGLAEVAPGLILAVLRASPRNDSR